VFFAMASVATVRNLEESLTDEEAADFISMYIAGGEL
jgi:hypothetical protein